MIKGNELETIIKHMCGKYNIDPNRVTSFVEKITNRARIEFAIVPDEFPQTMSLGDYFEIFLITGNLLYDIEVKHDGNLTHLVVPFRSIVSINHQVKSETQGFLGPSVNFDIIVFHLVNGKDFYLINSQKYSDDTLAFIAKVQAKMGESK